MRSSELGPVIGCQSPCGSSDRSVVCRQRSLVQLMWMWLILAGVLGVLFEPSLVEACPNCKDTLAEHGGRLQYGYALSIALMIAMPFGILAAWATAIYRMLKTGPQSS